MTFRLREADIERLFGEGRPVDPELGSLAELIERTRVRFTARPPDEVRRQHLTAMRIARAQPGPAAVRARRPSFWPGVAAAAAAVALIAGVALAAGGHLPGRLQDAASAAGHRIGIEIPAGDRSDGRPQHADDNQERAKAFTEAEREWLDCAREVRATEGADPEEVCGPKPHPHDFRQDDPTTEVSAGTTQPSEDPVPSRGTPASPFPGHSGGQVSDGQGPADQGQGDQDQGDQGSGQGEQGQPQEKGQSRSQGRGQGQQADGNADEDRGKAKKKAKPDRS